MRRRWAVPYKKAVVEYAQAVGRDAKSYRSFDVPKMRYYDWNRANREEGVAGLIL